MRGTTVKDPVEPIRLPWLLLLALGLLAAGGCTGQALLDAQSGFRRGNLTVARASIADYVADSRGSADEVIARLEQGTILRAGGEFDRSNAALAEAEQAIERLDRRPEVSLSAETLAAVSNLNVLPYRGYHYDRVMLNAYRALNYLQLGDLEAARVELRRTFERQSAAVEHYAEQIEEAREAARRADTAGVGPDYDVDRALRHPRLERQLERVYGEIGPFDPYAVYVNPFAEWLQGVYYLHVPADSADLERARLALRRVAGMIEANPHIDDDVAAAEAAGQGEALEPVTYVIFETGTAPHREPVRIDIPLFLINDTVDYVGASFPTLEPNPHYVRQLEVRTEEGLYRTALLADMDRVIRQEFHHELPVTVIKTLIAAGTKATAAYGLNRATRGDETLNALVRIATTLYQYSVNQADLRTWGTLPKQFQYARFRTPADRRLALRAAGRSAGEIELLPGRVNVVYVKSIRPGDELRIWQFLLRK